ncbi:hypothetical protein GGR57DRAFT_476396 [Xylariaceae sp. FL1272]|nr:hypothetical protein GGR57DRAFT_476396 [Xylariaceae sp. FL1272]
MTVRFLLSRLWCRACAVIAENDTRRQCAVSAGRCKLVRRVYATLVWDLFTVAGFTSHEQSWSLGAGTVGVAGQLGK